MNNFCPKCKSNKSLIDYVRKQGVSKATSSAMRKTDRIKYVLDQDRSIAYFDNPISIGYNVTISQPSLVGKMIDKLEVDSINNILELGTRSAYNAAILEKLIPFGTLTTVERVKNLGKRAKKLLKSSQNIRVIIGDAVNIKYLHLFDRIIVTAEFMTKKQINNFILNNAATFCIAIYPYEGTLWKMIKCRDVITINPLMKVRFVPVL